MKLRKPMVGSQVRLAVIGMGTRMQNFLQSLCSVDSNVRLVAIADPDGEPARLRCAEFHSGDSIRCYDNADDLLAHAKDFDGILIGAPCDLHAPLAQAVARTGLPLFLEKPVAISWEQLEGLHDAYAGWPIPPVVVSFPLRLTAHINTAAEILRSGRLGVVNQFQLVNNVAYGGVYYGQWFRDYRRTGGLWLQKATHDIDYLNCLVEAAAGVERGPRPVSVAAMHGRTFFGGSLEPDLHCKACNLTEQCPESPLNLTLRGSDGGTLNYQKPTLQSDHACCFSRDILHQDAGSALIMYSNGVHASYVQNFLPRMSAGQRGATVIGSDATLRFDWQTDTVTIIDHHRDRVDRITVAGRGGHGGGDEALARNFLGVIRGEQVSLATLRQGILSAAICLAARDAANRGVNQPIPEFASSAGGINLTPRGEIEPSGPFVTDEPLVSLNVRRPTIIRPMAKTSADRP